METKLYKHPSRYCIYTIKGLCRKDDTYIPPYSSTNELFMFGLWNMGHLECYRYYRTVWFQEHMEKYSNELLRRLEKNNAK